MCYYNTGYAADLSVGEDDEVCVTITLAMLQTCLWGKTMRCVYNTGHVADLSVGEDDEMCV